MANEKINFLTILIFFSLGSFAVRYKQGRSFTAPDDIVKRNDVKIQFGKENCKSGEFLSRLPFLNISATDEIGKLPVKFQNRSRTTINREMILEFPSRIDQACDCDHDLLILVKSAIQNSKNRKKIRETWTFGDKNLIGFLLGKPNKSETLLIQKEQYENNDLIIGNFLDTYYNLTRKSVMGKNLFRT